MSTQGPAVDIIVPTYREAENLEGLLGRISAVQERNRHLGLRVTLVDDNSEDGTENVVDTLAFDWVDLIVRKQDRGLSTAVLRGMRDTRQEYIVVMDADLSHPPELIPDLIATLDDGADFVIGSRYVEGASTDDKWGLLRWLNSKVATWLSRPFTSVRDPMSGFFALRRATFEAADELNPIGYKIGLELIVKCRCQRVRELPFHFADRAHGQSKLSLNEQLKYVRHVARLALYKIGVSRIAR